MRKFAFYIATNVSLKSFVFILRFHTMNNMNVDRQFNIKEMKASEGTAYVFTRWYYLTLVSFICLSTLITSLDSLSKKQRTNPCYVVAYILI
jgi:hypothetical protein